MRRDRRSGIPGPRLSIRRASGPSIETRSVESSRVAVSITRRRCHRGRAVRRPGGRRRRLAHLPVPPPRHPEEALPPSTRYSASFSLGRDLDHASFPAATQGTLDHPDGVPGLLRRDRHLAFPQDRGGHPGVEGLVGAGDAGQPAGQLQPGGLGGDGPVAVGGRGPPARSPGRRPDRSTSPWGSMPYLTNDPLSPWTSKCGTRARTKEPACRITRSWP